MPAIVWRPVFGEPVTVEATLVGERLYSIEHDDQALGYVFKDGFRGWRWRYAADSSLVVRGAGAPSPEEAVYALLRQLRDINKL